MSSDRNRLWPATLVLIASFCSLVIFTRPLFIGDTYWYVLDIKNSFGYGWANYAKLWDFAHILWRPLGKILSNIFLPLILGHFHNNVSTSITFLLVCLNVLAALICGLVVQAAAWRLTGNRWTATLAAVAFLCTNAVLNYSRSGCSYVIGLAFFLMAFYMVGFSRSSSWKVVVFSGFLFSIAVLLWVPYLISFPAVLLTSTVLNLDGSLGQRRELRFAVLVCLSVGLLVAGAYAVAIGCLHIRTVHTLFQWIYGTTRRYSAWAQGSRAQSMN